MARTVFSVQAGGVSRRTFAGLAMVLAMGVTGAVAQTPAPAPRPGDNIIEAAARPALVIEGKSEWAEGHTAIANAFQRLRAETQRAGLKAAGRPLAVFVFTDDMGFRFQGMLPIEEPAPPAPQLGAEFAIGKTPGGRAVKFEHRGAYDEIDATYDAVTAWLDDRNLVAQDFFVEEWLNDVASSSDVDAAVDLYVFLR